MANPIPSEAEIRAAAMELGLADADGNYDRANRSRIAQAIVIANDEKAASKTATTDRQLFVQEVAALERDLLHAAVGIETTSRVVAAMSAALWRGVREEGNRTS